MRSLNPEESRRPATDSQSEDEPDGQSPQVDVVCVFVSSAEAGGLVDRLSGIRSAQCAGFTERIGMLGEKRVAIVETEQPHEKLAMIVRDVIAVRKPKWMLSAGLVVGLASSVKSGEIVVADRIIDDNGYSLSTGTKMPESKGLRVGTVLTRALLPTLQAEKSQLANMGALACDTQAALVAEVCRVMKTPMMGVHCVAESRNESHSQIIGKVKSQDSLAGMIGAAAGALLDQPGSVREFWHDKEKALRLSDRLSGFLVGVIDQLPV